MSLKSIFKQVISKGMIKKAISIARYEGLGSLLTKVRSKCRGGREFSDAIDRNKDAKSPLVSIIIPVYNASKYTAECLESLYSVKNTTDFEVILIDNGSTDDTPDLIIEQSRLKDALYYFSQEKNLGFSGGVNLGIRHSKGKYIVILNNDTRVSNHWLDRLVAHAEQNPDVGIFSAITNYIGEGPQMAEDAKALGIDQINDYAASIAGRNLEIEPTRLVFFCVLIRRTLLDMIGLLDEDYIKGNFEDDDYCLRALLSGYKLAIAKDSFVYHHGSVTFHKNRIPHTSYMEENRKRFFEKVQRLSTASRSTRRLTSTPTTSLILRTLNRPALLSRALASLGNQTIKNFEVVVVNDGGEDVKNILDRYQQDFLIDYVHNQKSLGRTAALNVGIERAKGDWIGFLDDDDILYPWHFAVFAKELASKRDKLFL